MQWCLMCDHIYSPMLLQNIKKRTQKNQSIYQLQNYYLYIHSFCTHIFRIRLITLEKIGI